MPRRVLIVEAHAAPDPVLREGLSAIDPAFEIDSTSSVPSAVERLSEIGYDLIVADDVLEGARAGLFLRHLCERRFPTVPFVLLSSSAEESPEPALLRRPLSVDRVREQIERLLGR